VAASAIRSIAAIMLMNSMQMTLAAITLSVSIISSM
jgi:hypothetical protein